MYYIHDSLRGMNELISCTKTINDKVSIIALLNSLEKDTLATLEVKTTKKMKGTKNKFCEIVEDSMRIFYCQQGEDITIVHFCYKQKNKTEKKDIDIADKRVGELKHRK